MTYLGAWVLGALAATADDVSIVNGGFESGPGEGGSIPGWELSIGARNGADAPVSTVSRDTSVAHGGGASLRFSGNKKTRAWQIAEQELPMRPGGTYRLSAWMRTAGVLQEGGQFHNCYLMLIFQDPGGTSVGRKFVTPDLPSSEWGQRTIELVAPKSAASAKVWVMLSMSGDLWVDDVELSIEGGEERPPAEVVFEEGFAKGTRLPARWRTKVGATNGTGGTDSVAVVDSEVGADGSPHSLKLSGDVNTMRWRSVERELKAEPGELFRVRAFAKAQDVRREGVQFENCHVRLAFLDKKGNGLGDALYGNFGAGTYDWKEATAMGVTPDGTKKVLVSIFLSMSGTVWIDDVEVTRQGGYEPPYFGWKTITNKDVVLRYAPDHPNAKQMKNYARSLAESKKATCAALEVEFPEKITVFIYKGNEEGRALTGRGLDFADPRGRRVHQRWNSYIGHEMVHVIAHTMLNDARTGILGEGIAVWLNGQPPDRHHRTAMDLFAKGELPSVENLLTQFREEKQGYPASGSFCGFFLEKHGLELFKEIYPLEDPSAAAKEKVGQSFVEMEAEWHELLQKYR